MGGNRGNFQLSHGFNHMDINDGNKIEEMNLARCHAKPRQLTPNLDDDDSMEETLLRLQIIVIKHRDYIINYFGTDRIYQSWNHRQHFLWQK